MTRQSSTTCPALQATDAVELLQYERLMMSMTISGNVKHGRARANLNGIRVDYTARSVVSGNPTIAAWLLQHGLRRRLPSPTEHAGQ